jgi:hypothetical protein
LKENKKLFIYFPYRRGDGKKVNYSMEKLQEVLEKQTGKKGIIYHGKVNGAVTQTLYNVEEVWKCHDFVITNNKITVGVNYDNEEEAYKFDMLGVPLMRGCIFLPQHWLRALVPFAYASSLTLAGDDLHSRYWHAYQRRVVLGSTLAVCSFSHQ